MVVRAQGVSQRFAEMLGRHELPDPIMKSLDEMQLIVKKHTDQSGVRVIDNVNIGIVLSGI